LFSCSRNAIKGLIWGFVIGYGTRAIFGLITTLALKRVFTANKILKSTLLSKKSLNLGLFLGSYNLLFKGSNCLLRFFRQKEDGFNSAIAGAIAGSSMLFWNSSELALYLTARAAECVFNLLVERGYLKSWYYGDSFLFAICTAFMFHAFMFEPKNLRPSYYNLLLKIVDGREMDRTPVKEQGFHNF